jgi:hypothetical protein
LAKEGESMTRVRRLIMIVAVVGIAMGTGHIMQDGRTGPRLAAAPAVKAAAVPLSAVLPAEQGQPFAAAAAASLPQLAALDLGELSPVLRSRTDVPAAPLLRPAEPSQPAPEVRPGALPASPATGDVAVEAAQPCRPVLTLAAAPGAMIHAALDAACAAGARAVIRHEGLSFTVRVGDDGRLDLALPAFADPATVTVQLPDDTASARVAVPGVAAFERFAVQWMGDDAFQLRAWRDAAGTVPAAAAATAGPGGDALVRLGASGVAAPILAEVYTFPAGAEPGDVRLDIEAAVTDATCGRDLIGETLQLSHGQLLLRELTMPMPGCDAIGGALVMENPQAPLSVASN